MEIAKQRRILVSFCMKIAEMCFEKTSVNLGRCYGNQGEKAVEKYFFLFWKLVHLNCQKVSSP